LAIVIWLLTVAWLVALLFQAALSLGIGLLAR
jgi:hypothetical protein